LKALEMLKIMTELKSQQQDKTELAEENTKLAEENATLNEQLNKISQYNPVPLIIKSLEIGNTYYDRAIETQYGDTLHSSTSMYLTPQIEYIGLKKDTTITLYAKLYRKGILKRKYKISPSRYTYKYDITISGEGTVSLLGWGSETKGSWSTGNYRYEIWYNGVCLKAVDFTLY
jgi:hypothetical protein